MFRNSFKGCANLLLSVSDGRSGFHLFKFPMILYNSAMSRLLPLPLLYSCNSQQKTGASLSLISHFIRIAL